MRADGGLAARSEGRVHHAGCWSRCRASPEARALAKSRAVTAIMDNSDGLPLSFSDLAQVSPGGLCGAGGDAARSRGTGGDGRAGDKRERW